MKEVELVTIKTPVRLTVQILLQLQLAMFFLQSNANWYETCDLAMHPLWSHWALVIGLFFSMWVPLLPCSLAHKICLSRSTKVILVETSWRARYWPGEDLWIKLVKLHFFASWGAVSFWHSERFFPQLALKRVSIIQLDLNGVTLVWQLVNLFPSLHPH